MYFLQNSLVQIYGNLKLLNVLIDSYWICKLIDYGLFFFKEGQEIDVEVGEDFKYYGKYIFDGKRSLVQFNNFLIFF